MGDDDNACVRNIVKELVRECFPRKIKVNKNFLTFLTKLLLIDPNWGINDDFFNQRENVQRFVKYIIDELLTQQDYPSMVTLKIQFFFACNLDHLDFAVETNRRDLKHQLVRLKEDIFLVTEFRDKEEVDNLFKKIVYYITLLSGLGNPALPKVYEEALMALKSIVDDDELKEFAKQPKSFKHESLDQFTKVVAGIRLFNKDCEKGGEGIADLPVLLTKAISVIKSGMEALLLFIMEKVNLLTTLVDKCYVVKETIKGYTVLFEIPEATKKIIVGLDINRIKDLLIFFRQYELLSRRILEEVDHLHDKADIIFKNMKKLLRVIHDTVYMRIAIPVGTVFPLFENLAEIWMQLQDQVYLLSRYSQIMSNLDRYANQTNYDQYLVEMVIGEEGSMSDAERLKLTASDEIRSINPEVSVYGIETFKDIDMVELEYLGFCCWKLIETKGALIPGNPSMGVARFEGKNYVFSCKEAFHEFCKAPQTCINNVLVLARKKPQLINFFQIKEQLQNVYSVEALVPSQTDIRMCEDKAVQAVTHSADGKIEHSYKWNVWDLKKEALLMANLSNCKTISTQTDKASSKNAVRTQTYAVKVEETQTSSDSYTSVPKHSNFIYGLRGRKDAEQFIVELTRPVDE